MSAINQKTIGHHIFDVVLSAGICEVACRSIPGLAEVSHFRALFTTAVTEIALATLKSGTPPITQMGYGVTILSGLFACQLIVSDLANQMLLGKLFAATLGSQLIYRLA